MTNRQLAERILEIGENFSEIFQFVLEHEIRLQKLENTEKSDDFSEDEYL
jgi:hypothetical protein